MVFSLNNDFRILLFIWCGAGQILCSQTWECSIFSVSPFASVKLGFFTYAPHVLVVTRLPMLLGTRKGTASVTGFIDMMGYIGATFTGIATALFTGLGGWNMAFAFWAVGAFGSAMALALLWNLKKKKETYM